MNIIDNLKAKKELKEMQPKITGMYDSWNNIINIYNEHLSQHPSVELRDGDTHSVWNNMTKTVNGQTYSIGASKVTYTNGQNPNYEFLIVTTDEQGQINSNFYTMTASGNFDNARGLSSFDIEYLSNIDGNQVPCTARINMNTADLTNPEQANLTPQVKPSVSVVKPQECPPNANDIITMLEEFGRINQISSRINKSESTSDYIPGR